MYQQQSNNEDSYPNDRARKACRDDVYLAEEDYPRHLDADSPRDPFEGYETTSYAEALYEQESSDSYPIEAACEQSHSLAPLDPAPFVPLPGEPDPKRPLRLTYLGPHFRGGGVAQHTLSLAKFLNPRRVRLTKYLIVGASAGQHSNTGLPFPIQSCGAGEISLAVRDCDVLLMWGDGFNGRLNKSRPLCVYLAHGESWWTRKGLLSSGNVVDHVIAVSRRVEQQVCRGFPTTTIANGVDSARLGQTGTREAARARFAFTPSDYVLGTVGRFTLEKRTDLLIKAVALLPPNFKLLLVGYGSRRAELLELANERIPGRFAFVQANDYLGDHYRAMDAFCLPSTHEGFGLVIPEAMLCERPVIATNVGCVPEVLRDRISGLVVEHTAQAFAQAATLLQTHPEWARGLALEGRAFADRHLHAARMARDYENLLLRLHRGRTAGKREAAR